MRGSELISLRKEAGLTQKKLAELLEVTRQTVIQWEKAEKVLRANELAIRQAIYEHFDKENGNGRG